MPCGMKGNLLRALFFSAPMTWPFRGKGLHNLWNCSRADEHPFPSQSSRLGFQVPAGGTLEGSPEEGQANGAGTSTDGAT